MTQILVLFSSIYGANAALAEAAGGALESAGADVRVRGVPQLVLGKYEVDAAKAHPKATADDLAWAEGFVFTSPAHTGAMAASLKAFVDDNHDAAIAGQFLNTTFTAMATAELPHSGQEVVVNQLNGLGAAWGCVLVPPSTANSELNALDGNAFGISFTLDNGKLPEGIQGALNDHLQRFVQVTEALASVRKPVEDGAAKIVTETDQVNAKRHTISSALS